MFGNHGLGGLLEEGGHGKSPKCLGENLGDFGEFCKGLDISVLPREPDTLFVPIDHVAIIEYTAGYPIEIVSLRSQLTREVIDQNSRLTKSVQVDFQKIIVRSKRKVLYHRHIIYTALNIPDTVGWQHADALLNGYEETKHRNHNDISVRHIDNERHIDRIIAIRRRDARNEEKRHNQSKPTNRPRGRK